MTVTDIDIWRAANLLVKRHGDDAAIVAAQRADRAPKTKLRTNRLLIVAPSKSAKTLAALAS